MMTKRKILLLTGLFLILITSLRILWVFNHVTADHPLAVKGVIDLREWDFNHGRSITLDGQWAFTPHSLLIADPFIKRDTPEETNFIQVPGKWDQAFGSGKEQSFKYGTYHLRILVNKENSQPYSILFPDIKAGSELYVDGLLLANAGHPSDNYDDHKARFIPYSASFTAKGDEIDLQIRISSLEFKHLSTIERSIRFGSSRTIDRERLMSFSMELIVCIVLFLHGLYAILLYLIGSRQRMFVYFACLNFFFILSVLVDDSKLLLIWLPINLTWSIKLSYITYISTITCMIQFGKHIFPNYINNKLFNWAFAINGVYVLFILVTPLHIFLPTLPLTLIASLEAAVLLPWLFTRALQKEREPAILFILFAATSITSNIIWGLFKTYVWIAPNYYPFDIIICFLCFAAFWFTRFFRNAQRMENFAAKLQRADKIKDEFLANTSHELRNPLHGIINIAQTLLDDEHNAKHKKSSENLELIINVGRRMSFMLNDLLDLSLLKEKSIHLQITSLHIQSVASGVLDILRFMTDGKPIQLIIDIPDTFPKIDADENRLIQIIFNLLHNAVKFTDEGQIIVSATARNGKACIQIKDTGIGMDEETTKRIFQPYEQADSSLTAVGGGIGLGLSICKQLVELHAGELSVESRPGQGSEFTFTMPLSKQTKLYEESIAELATLAVYREATASLDNSIAEPLALNAVQLNNKPKILAVDDDPLNLKILVNILAPEQYEVVTVTNGKDAIALLSTGHWDLIISDVMMPYMSGYELSRIVRERFSISELPILLLTARNTSEDVYTGFLSGASDYVMKPMDALELKSRVRALTDLKQSIAERLRMEGAWLQAQIKPHFLFNTLNTIAALSDFDTTRMRDLLEVFGDYLHTSFDSSNLEMVVPLEHELKLVRAYLFIEKARFEDRLKVNWEVDESITLLLPPLAIQTLVENAVRHGILKRVSGGTIIIRVTNLTDFTQISIIDDGVGISEDKLKNLLSAPSNKKRGIGLLNTERRLKQIYGNGLDIQSEEGLGTTISFKIPR